MQLLSWFVIPAESFSSSSLVLHSSPSPPRSPHAQTQIRWTSPPTGARPSAPSASSNPCSLLWTCCSAASPCHRRAAAPARAPAPSRRRPPAAGRLPATPPWGRAPEKAWLSDHGRRTSSRRRRHSKPAVERSIFFLQKHKWKRLKKYFRGLKGKKKKKSEGL